LRIPVWRYQPADATALSNGYQRPAFCDALLPRFLMDSFAIAAACGIVQPLPNDGRARIDAALSASNCTSGTGRDARP